MRLFDKLLNRKIKGRLETDDGINAENVIKKSNNIQTVVSYENNVVNVDKPVEVVGSVKSSQLEVEDTISTSNKLLLSGATALFDSEEIEALVVRFVSDGASYLIINIDVSILTTSPTYISISSLPTSLMENLQHPHIQYFPATNSLGGAGKVTVPVVTGSGDIAVNFDAGAVRRIYTTIILSKNVIDI